MKHARHILGVDIGNVVIDFQKVDTTDQNLMKERYSSIPATDGVFVTLKDLNTRFDTNVFLVSKCTEWAEGKIKSWLRDNGFYSKTGIREENVLFCRERPEKRQICNDREITHFVDDRLENLSYLVNEVERLYLFRPNEEEIQEYEEFLSRVIRVEGWSDVLQSIAEVAQPGRTAN